MENIFYPLFAAVVTSVIWFVAGGIVYMNPLVAKVYKEVEGHPGMKMWSNQKKYMVSMFVAGGLIPIVLISYAYELLSPIGVVEFGLLLVGVRIIPRMTDMWMQSSYPNKILVVELVNGIILSFVIALSLSLL